jgi:hypothetical protein
MKSALLYSELHEPMHPQQFQTAKVACSTQTPFSLRPSIYKGLQLASQTENFDAISLLYVHS